MIPEVTLFVKGAGAVVYRPAMDEFDAAKKKY